MIQPLKTFTHPDCYYNEQRGSVTVKVYNNTCICEFYPHNALSVSFPTLDKIQTKDDKQFWKETAAFETQRLFFSNFVFN